MGSPLVSEKYYESYGNGRNVSDSQNLIILRRNIILNKHSNWQFINRIFN